MRVRDAAGTAVATRRATSHSHKSTKADRSALLAFEVAQPGRYEISVEGGFPPRVFSVAPDRVMRPFIATFGAFAAVLLGLAAGFALWGWAYFKRDAAAEKAARAAPAASATPPTPPRRKPRCGG